MLIFDLRNNYESEIKVRLWNEIYFSLSFIIIINNPNNVQNACFSG